MAAKTYDCPYVIEHAAQLATHEQRLEAGEVRMDKVERGVDDMVKLLNTFVLKVATASISIMLVIAAFVVAIVKGWLG